MNQYIFPSITEQVTVSGTLHIATVAAGAMFFHDSVDFSAYANRGYRLEFEDNAGKKAWAFGGAVGGGEGLDGELVDGWTNGYYPFETFTAVGSNITQAINNAGGSGGAYKLVTAGAGKIYKRASTVTVVSGATPSFRWASNTSMGGSQQEFGSASAATAYRTMPGAYTHFFVLISDAVGEFSMTGFSLKALTDIPATGLLLNSTPFGSDRTMAGSESGFNPNTVVSVRILGKAKQGRGRILGI